MIEWLAWVALGWVPWWAWVIVVGVLIGWAWKVFGWQGVVGGIGAALMLGAYRLGWRHRDGFDRDVIGKEHPTNKGDIVVGRYTETPPPKKRRTLMDMWNGR